MGSEAYATGNAIAFKSAPDLHTAVHDATHILQQRGEIQLKGGVGQVGDAYEQHADAVAGGVVQGASVERLLDSMGPAQESTSSPTVQHKRPSLDPGSSFAAATSGRSESLPYQSEMEDAFEQKFGDVSVHTGQSLQVKSLGAEAATQGNTIAFADASPSKEVVAHELTHVVQNRQHGSNGGIAASSTVSRPSDSAEVEAEKASADVVAGKRVNV